MKRNCPFVRLLSVCLSACRCLHFDCSPIPTGTTNGACAFFTLIIPLSPEQSYARSGPPVFFLDFQARFQRAQSVTFPRGCTCQQRSTLPRLPVLLSRNQNWFPTVGAHGPKPICVLERKKCLTPSTCRPQLPRIIPRCFWTALG